MSARDDLARVIGNQEFDLFAHLRDGPERVRDLADAIIKTGWVSPVEVMQREVRFDRALAARDRKIAGLYKLLAETERAAADYARTHTTEETP